MPLCLSSFSPQDELINSSPALYWFSPHSSFPNVNVYDTHQICKVPVRMFHLKHFQVECTDSGIKSWLLMSARSQCIILRQMSPEALRLSGNLTQYQKPPCQFPPAGLFLQVDSLQKLVRLFRRRAKHSVVDPLICCVKCC